MLFATGPGSLRAPVCWFPAWTWVFDWWPGPFHTSVKTLTPWTTTVVFQIADHSLGSTMGGAECCHQRFHFLTTHAVLKVLHFYYLLFILNFSYRQICQLYLGKHTVTCLLADNSNTGGTAVNIFNSFPDKGHALLIISAGFTERKEKPLKRFEFLAVCAEI